MAKAEGIDDSGKNAKPDAKPADAPHSVLPQVESPSISLAIDPAVSIDAEPAKPAADAAAKTDAPAETAADLEFAKPDAGTAETGTAKSASILQFPVTLTPRLKRSALRAATIALAAGIGAAAGALTIQGLTPSAPKQDVASTEERQARQKSIARLAKDLTALKASIEASGKAASTKIGKLADRLVHVERDPVVTGSIAPVATAPAAKETPIPTPRPQIVQGWFAYESRDGFALVEQRGGDLFRVSPGTLLPGLGPVEAIRREGGQLVVVTPKGLITQAPRTTARNRVRPPFFLDDPY